MAYLGLAPSEHSSGATVWRGGITKAGNALAWRALIEGAWTYRMQARISRKLHDRNEKLPQAIREVTIAADPDDAGEAAAQTLARRLLREGREVRIARPPQRRQRLQRHPVVRSPRG